MKFEDYPLLTTFVSGIYSCYPSKTSNFRLGVFSQHPHSNGFSCFSFASSSNGESRVSSHPCRCHDIMTHSRCNRLWLSQWLTFKLLGIPYLVGKIKFKLWFHGPKWLSKDLFAAAKGIFFLAIWPLQGPRFHTPSNRNSYAGRKEKGTAENPKVFLINSGFVTQQNPCVLGSKLPLFPYKGDGHQPNSRGLYTHYKDSLLKVGWPSPIQRV